ncbi:MAG: hypothetical protein AVDCRST_MAG27-3171, partial [uncultured Craurococcus sp.]
VACCASPVRRCPPSSRRRPGRLTTPSAASIHTARRQAGAPPSRCGVFQDDLLRPRVRQCPPRPRVIALRLLQALHPVATRAAEFGIPSMSGRLHDLDCLHRLPRANQRLCRPGLRNNLLRRVCFLPRHSSHTSAASGLHDEQTTSTKADHANLGAKPML